MQIQILGLRDYYDHRRKMNRKSTRFFENGWRLNSIQEVFGPECIELVNKIPEHQRFNLYYTAAHCFEDNKRRMYEMHIIPFDIDNIEYNEGYKDTCMAVANCVARATGVPVDRLGVLFSGNGVQVIVNITTPIVDVAYFDQYRKHYGVICAKLEAELRTAGIKGEVDPTVFDDARILRLPHTYNEKKDKPKRMAEVIQGSVQPVEWDIVGISGIDEANVEVLSDAVLKNYAKPDSDAVVQECGFIQHCKNSPAIVKEYEWYAMISITARLDEGEKLTHDLSAGHPQYNSFETEAKIQQALASAGPRTCANISTMFEGCRDCKHWGNVKSPIQIKGPEYIASQDFGYRERTVDSKGNVKSGKPAFNDIIKAFSVLYNYRVMSDTKQTYIFKDTHWVEFEELFIRQWLANIIKPSPTMAESREALYRLQSANVVDRNEFASTAVGMLNFTNGIYSINEDKLYEHGPEYGFFYVIPYAYDAAATSPKWDAFLLQIMNGRQHLVDLLMEYAGYCLSYDSCWAQKCLVLNGTGSNGKSVFMETLGKVVGPNNASSIQLQDMLGSPTARFNMMHKMFNYSDETSSKVFRESALFKSLVQGGTMAVKKLYVQETHVENKTKLIISCNEVPSSNDSTHAFFRRFIIVPFDFVISPDDPGFNPRLKEDLWETELPGICNAIIRSYKKLIENKRFTDAPESLEMVREFQRETNTAQLFVEDCVEFTESFDDIVENSLLYQQYVLYCEMSNYDPLNSIVFFRRVQRLQGMNTRMTEIKRINNKAVRVRTRMKLNKEW